MDEVMAAAGAGSGSGEDAVARHQVPAADIVRFELRRGAAPESFGEVQPEQAGSVPDGADPWFPTGTPLSTPSDDDSRIEVAWDAWSGMRDAVGPPGPERKGKTVVVSGARLLAHLPSLMRQDPCMSVAVRMPGATDADGQALLSALGAAAPGEGGDAGSAAQYLQDWAAAAQGMAKTYSKRVFVGDDAASKAWRAV